MNGMSNTKKVTIATPDEAQSEQLKCLMEDAKPNCDCKLNHCLKNGW